MRNTESLQRLAGPGGTQAPGYLPRLLPAGLLAGPASLAGHLARYGPPPSPGLDRRRREGLLEEVGLREGPLGERRGFGAGGFAEADLGVAVLEFFDYFVR